MPRSRIPCAMSPAFPSLPIKACGSWTAAGPLLNLLALLCFFGVFFVALFTRDQVLLAAFGLPAGLFFFISIFTHALTRYNLPMTPFVILSVLWLVAALARVAYRRVPSFPQSGRPMRWARFSRRAMRAARASAARPCRRRAPRPPPAPERRKLAERAMKHSSTFALRRWFPFGLPITRRSTSPTTRSSMMH